LILIPSTQEAAGGGQANRASPLSERLSHAERVFQIDMKIDPTTNDLMTSPSGDVARSFGYENAVQALRLILETELGELEHHPTFGLSVSPGSKMDALSRSDLAARARGAIVADPRFADAEVTTVLEKAHLSVRVVAKGTSGTGMIPVEFQVHI
jgi:hypothetical protein